MDTRDREAIEGLFSKLGDVERQASPRDAEAEAFIASQIARQPGAPYYMAQTIVMQEVALTNQQQRLEELERELSAKARAGEGGLLSRILGGGASEGIRSVPRVGGSRPGDAWGRGGQSPQSPQGSQGGSPYGQPGQGFGRSMGGMGGGGFLAGAAQTAMGVAGGVLLGNALAGMFGGDEANAAEAATAEPAADDTVGADEPQVEDASANDGGWFGGDDSGGGGFDDV